MIHAEEAVMEALAKELGIAGLARSHKLSYVQGYAQRMTEEGGPRDEADIQ